MSNQDDNLDNDGGGERMFAALVETRRHSQHFVIAIAGSGKYGIKHRFANRQRAGFIDDQGVDFAKVFDRFGVAKQDAHICGTTGRYHD